MLRRHSSQAEQRVGSSTRLRNGTSTVSHLTWQAFRHTARCIRHSLLYPLLTSFAAAYSEHSNRTMSLASVPGSVVPGVKCQNDQHDNSPKNVDAHSSLPQILTKTMKLRLRTSLYTQAALPRMLAAWLDWQALLAQ